MLNGHSPFEAEDHLATYRKVLEGTVTYPQGMDTDAVDLIGRLLQKHVSTPTPTPTPDPNPYATLPLPPTRQATPERHLAPVRQPARGREGRQGPRLLPRRSVPVGGRLRAARLRQARRLRPVHVRVVCRGAAGHRDQAVPERGPGAVRWVLMKNACVWRRPRVFSGQDARAVSLCVYFLSL